jgi:hypothetical protein
MLHISFIVYKTDSNISEALLTGHENVKDILWNSLIIICKNEQALEIEKYTAMYHFRSDTIWMFCYYFCYENIIVFK